MNRFANTSRAVTRGVVCAARNIHSKLILLVFVALSTAAQSYHPPVDARTDLSLDSGWRFIRQDAGGAQDPHFNDSSWTDVNLPHTWNNLDGEDGQNIIIAAWAGIESTLRCG